VNTNDQIYPKRVIIERKNLGALFSALKKRGLSIIGPTVKDGAITYDTISSVDELPLGWTEVQNAATYRLKKRDDDALFGFNSTPQSWKRFLHPPTLKVGACERSGVALKEDAEEKLQQVAFFGVRSCDLAAIGILDKVLLGSLFTVQPYKIRRENVFIVAVNCTQAGGTCFCTSMNTGPKAEKGFDLALTEIIAPNRHFFVTEIGTEAGAGIMAGVPNTEATDRDTEASGEAVSKAAAEMGRTLDTEGIKGLLYRNVENKQWHETAKRCLTCTNCTMVCPTCFCTTIEDSTDLTGSRAERTRRWDSCFNLDFSYIHGGSVRPSVYSRYRQWLTHKFAAWHDQFGTSGCVGCGRCITWCPVGIDVTEEINSIRKNEKTTPSTISAKENN
jgi:formate hydrogenlyase subunit 6/NADH:ubiquinone oxidoreductase subunit I